MPEISWPPALTSVGWILALLALVIIVVLMIVGKLTGFLALVLVLLALSRLL